MSPEDFATTELDFRGQVESFIEACTSAGFDPKDRLLDIIFDAGIEVEV